MESAGLWMLLAVAIVLLGSGLPAYAVLMGVSALFAAVGLLAGVLNYGLLTALPSRIIGLLETDLLQALPLYVSLAMTFATRERAHLAVDAIAHDYPAAVRGTISRWGGFACVAPWAAFMIWTIGPTAWRSAMMLEKFSETLNPGYFLIKVAALLLAVLALAQASIDVLRKPA